MCQFLRCGFKDHKWHIFSKQPWCKASQTCLWWKTIYLFIYFQTITHHDFGKHNENLHECHGNVNLSRKFQTLTLNFRALSWWGPVASSPWTGTWTVRKCLWTIPWEARLLRKGCVRKEGGRNTLQDGDYSERQEAWESGEHEKPEQDFSGYSDIFTFPLPITSLGRGVQQYLPYWWIW